VTERVANSLARWVWHRAKRPAPTHRHPPVARNEKWRLRVLPTSSKAFSLTFSLFFLSLLPHPAPGGCGGCYIFRDEAGRPVALMKPGDEEPTATASGGGGGGGGIAPPPSHNNNNNLLPTPPPPSVRPGEAMLREAAAYLLDHGGFAKVPPTALVRMTHPAFAAGRGGTAHPPASPAPSAPAQPSPPGAPLITPAFAPTKLGSLQAYTPHAGDAGEAGAGRFPTRDVHAIACLDIRLLNTDRHAGNILVRPLVGGGGGGGGGVEARCGGQAAARCLPRAARASAAVFGEGAAAGGAAAALACAVARPDCPAAAVAAAAASAPPPCPPPLVELVPIDHGFSLPEALSDDAFLEWLHWPQAGLPLDGPTLAYIAALDPDADVALLQDELPSLRDESLRVLQVGTRLLQRCCAGGRLTLRDVGLAVTRPLATAGVAGSCGGTEASALERLCWAARADVDGAAGLGPGGVQKGGSSAECLVVVGGAGGGGGGGECHAPPAVALATAPAAEPEPALLFHLESAPSADLTAPTAAAPGALCGRAASSDSGRGGGGGGGGAGRRLFTAASSSSPDSSSAGASAAAVAALAGPSPDSTLSPIAPHPKPSAISVATTGGGWAGKGGSRARPPHPAASPLPPPLAPPPPPADASVTAPLPTCPLAGLEGERWLAFLEAFESRLAEILRAGRWEGCGAGGPGGGTAGWGGGGPGGRVGAALGKPCPI